MRIIKLVTLRTYWRRYPDAEVRLKAWAKIVEDRHWGSIRDVREQFPHADAVMTDKGSVVTVFNIGGGRYRLIVAIHYNTQCVYIRDFLTHADYDKNEWKARN